MAKNMPDIIKHVLAFGVIAFKTIGDTAQHTLTITSTLAVATLTAFCGSDQSRQLYKYGCPLPTSPSPRDRENFRMPTLASKKNVLITPSPA